MPIDTGRPPECSCGDTMTVHTVYRCLGCDVEQWDLNDAVRAYHPCVEHQPDAWEGDGTCVICEGQRLRARVARLEAALRNIRIAAARGVSFGHQATPHTSERMVERKDEALHCVIEFCGQAGVTGSVLRDAALTGEKEHLRPHDVAHLALTRKTDAP